MQRTRRKAGLSEVFMRVADRPHRWEGRERGLPDEQAFSLIFVPALAIQLMTLIAKEKPLPGLDLEGLKGSDPWGQKEAGDDKSTRLSALRFHPDPNFLRKRWEPGEPFSASTPSRLPPQATHLSYGKQIRRDQGSVALC